jgi:hypothetical protein
MAKRRSAKKRKSTVKRKRLGLRGAALRSAMRRIDNTIRRAKRKRAARR